MKPVCFLNNHLYLRGGAERVMFMEAALLRGSGHDVCFFGCRGPDDIEHGHEAFLPPRVVIDQLAGWARWRHAPRIIYNPAHGRAFRRFLDAASPGLLHAHNIYGGLTPAVLDVARQAGLPVVLTVHDSKLVCPSYLGLDHGRVCTACAGGRFYHCLLKRCHKSSFAASAVYTAEAYLTALGRKHAPVRRFLCPSRFMQRRLIDSGYAAERVVYLPNSVDTAGVEATPGEGSRALYVGRLSNEKGLRTLLQAMRGLDMPLRVVGDGPLRGELEAESARLGLGNRVTFAGHQTGAAMDREYREAAFLALPSEWHENAPMSALEAFARGKPVVGADIGGIPEIVGPGETGLLFPAGDAIALRDRMETLWRDRARRQAYGRAARNRAETAFSPERHLSDLLEIYENCLCRG